MSNFWATAFWTIFGTLSVHFPLKMNHLGMPVLIRRTKKGHMNDTSKSAVAAELDALAVNGLT